MRVAALHRAALTAPLGLLLTGVAASAQPPATAPTPLSAPQRAALVLGRWETCIDVSVNFLAQDIRDPVRLAPAAEARCESYAMQLRPIIAETLRDMMYGSSEPQVTEQTDAAMASLRRHIRSRALAAMEKARGK